MLLTESLHDTSAVGDSAVGDFGDVGDSGAMGDSWEPAWEAAKDAARAALRCLHRSIGHLIVHWASFAQHVSPAKHSKAATGELGGIMA